MSGLSNNLLRAIAADDSWSRNLSEMADGSEREIDIQAMARELLAFRQAGAAKCEARFNDDGTLDEVVGVGMFHLEQIDAGHWWMQLGPHHVNLSARGKITVHFGENVGRE